MGAWFAGLTRTVSSLPCWASTTWPLPDPSAATQWWTFLRYDLCDPQVIMWLPINFHYTAFISQPRFFFFSISIAQENMLYLQIIKQLENFFFLCTDPLFFFSQLSMSRPDKCIPIITQTHSFTPSSRYRGHRWTACVSVQMTNHTSPVRDAPKGKSIH